MNRCLLAGRVRRAVGRHIYAKKKKSIGKDWEVCKPPVNVSASAWVYICDEL